MNKAIKSLYLTALAFSYASHAMESPAKRWQPWQTEWKKAVCAPKDAFTNLPDAIAPLDWDAPITDELLLADNPHWLYVKEFDQETKNAILSNILEYPKANNYGHRWHCMRSAIALIVCLGAHPDQTVSRCDAALIWSANRQDFPLTKYLLEKGANPNVGTSEYHGATSSPLTIVRSLPLTELLVAHGAIIDPKILQHCCLPAYHSDVMRYYLNQTCLATAIANFKKPDSQSLTLLHHLIGDNKLRGEADYTCEMWSLSSCRTGYNQIEKVCSLLQAGFDPACQDQKGNTPLHFATMRQSKGICAALLTHSKIQLRKPFFEFLLCVKELFPAHYPPKDIRKKIFQELACQQLHALLTMQNKKEQTKEVGETAYDIWNRQLQSLTEQAQDPENNKGPVNISHGWGSKQYPSMAAYYYEQCEYHQSMVDLLNPNSCSYAKIVQAKEELEKAKSRALEKEEAPSSAGLHEPEYDNPFGC